MNWKNLTEAQIAWILWNLHERFNHLRCDRYEKEFLNWAMDENERKEMERIMEKELEASLESEF